MKLSYTKKDISAQTFLVVCVKIYFLVSLCSLGLLANHICLLLSKHFLKLHVLENITRNIIH